MSLKVKYFIIATDAIDEETRYLDRLESKIRRPSASSVDAEEISEHMDVSIKW